jgi:ribosomal-protein-serine acetyltransferase
MHARKINKEIEIKLSVSEYADELFALTDTNRQFLKQWLPWLDSVTQLKDTKIFIQSQLEQFAKNEAIHYTIFDCGEMVGVAGFNKIDHTNGIGHLGYWLAEPFNGKGTMTQVVEALIALATDELNLQRIEIRCATENYRSRAIPERLGFMHEGTIRRAEKIYDKWLDHEIYGRLLPLNQSSSTQT